MPIDSQNDVDDFMKRCVSIHKMMRTIWSVLVIEGKQNYPSRAFAP